MNIYHKGWYSIVKCEKIEVDTIEERDLGNLIRNEKRKFFFIKNQSSKKFIRYQVIRKTYINADIYNKIDGLSNKKYLILKRNFFDYYLDKKVLLFNTGANKIRGIIRYLNNNSESNISLPKNVNLTNLIEKIKETPLYYKLIEGRIVNVKIENDIIGNFHFKNYNKIEYPTILNQKDSYLSWIKLLINFSNQILYIKLYSNGSYYQEKDSSLVLKILKLYLKIRG